MGIRDERTEAKFADAPVKAALVAPFISAQETPLQKSHDDSVKSMSKSNRAAVRQFRTKQLGRVANSISEQRALVQQWRGTRPEGIKNLLSVNALVLACLLKRCGFNGRNGLNT